ncbi:hypothetical protein GCM10010331_49760 [Streptomyces xanthochromogenes]|uniref:hypothetical protein n=1 Tax=Streptomyces xanthochromogenes TaxID=67384 RepID=UPI0016758CDC|nr:hypothetical protein [Streptomyces xanthochromogenes]GHB55935.1 hypothetical protein GCM10010331_49760 [Streptomyces xanthochromogenes]
MKTMVVLLAAGRCLPNTGIVTAALADLALNIAEGPVIVRHGACPGQMSGDQAASDWIRACGSWLGVLEDPMPADWDACAPDCPTDPGHRRTKAPGDTAHPGLLSTYCPGAGPRRNAAMVAKQPRPDLMIAAPDPHGPSYGTRNCARLARQAGIEVWEVRP